MRTSFVTCAAVALALLAVVFVTAHPQPQSTHHSGAAPKYRMDREVPTAADCQDRSAKLYHHEQCRHQRLHGASVAAQKASSKQQLESLPFRTHQSELARNNRKGMPAVKSMGAAKKPASANSNKAGGGKTTHKSNFQTQTLQLPNDPAGALVAVTAHSTVGVLLDDMPAGTTRAAFAEYIMAQDDLFWIARAKRQILMTNFRLTFRRTFYNQSEGIHQQLILPANFNELWHITLLGAAETQTVQGHELITRPFFFRTTILTDYESPGLCEAVLGTIGGVFNETYVLPIDPSLLVQRTGFACMDEAAFPRGSVDALKTEYFYDDGCEVEEPPAPSANPNVCPTCHCTQFPQESCVAALERVIGSLTIDLQFERIPFDSSLANEVRADAFSTETPRIAGYANIHDMTNYFENTQLVYKYFVDGGCELHEPCIAAPGWRRVLMFDNADENSGDKPLHIGPIEFNDLGDPLVTGHGQYEFDPCHGHYHFKHYGKFSFGQKHTTANSKRGFCLESVIRSANAEWSPWHSPYDVCSYQGISGGWADIYQEGIPCQWIDVTDYDTKAGAYVDTLKAEANMDSLLCEGVKVLDANNETIWVPTEFNASLTGERVYMAQCNFYPAFKDDNTAELDREVPMDGHSVINGACRYAEYGAARDCNFNLVPGAQMMGYSATGVAGPANTTVSLTCRVNAIASITPTPQVVRVCESSIKLKSGTACKFDAALANAIVPVTGTVTVTFKTPPRRDSIEVGGVYSLYSATLLPGVQHTGVSCSVTSDSSLIEEDDDKLTAGAAAGIAIAASFVFFVIVLVVANSLGFLVCCGATAAAGSGSPTSANASLAAGANGSSSSPKQPQQLEMQSVAVAPAPTAGVVAAAPAGIPCTKCGAQVGAGRAFCAVCGNFTTR